MGDLADMQALGGDANLEMNKSIVDAPEDAPFNADNISAVGAGYRPPNYYMP